MKPTLFVLLLMTAAIWAQDAPKITQAIIEVK